MLTLTWHSLHLRCCQPVSQLGWYRKLLYCRGTARRAMVVNSCDVSPGIGRFQTAKVAFKVIQGHWQWCHSGDTESSTNPPAIPPAGRWVNRCGLQPSTHRPASGRPRDWGCTVITAGEAVLIKGISEWASIEVIEYSLVCCVQLFYPILNVWDFLHCLRKPISNINKIDTRTRSLHCKCMLWTLRIEYKKQANEKLV